MIKITAIAACVIATIHVSASTFAADATKVSADRAWHLAAMYYHRYVSGCGGVGAVVARGNAWAAPVHFGLAGTFRGYIRVDRQTGTVSYSGHRTVSSQSLDSWFASVTKRTHVP